MNIQIAIDFGYGKIGDIDAGESVLPRFPLVPRLSQVVGEANAKENRLVCAKLTHSENGIISSGGQAQHPLPVHP